MPNLFHCLQQNPMFAHLDDYAFHVIERHLSFRALDPDETLFAEGERGDYVAFVVAGSLAISKRGANGETIAIANIGVGDSIGEMAIIDELSRSATVQATERSALVILPKADFDHILVEHPRIGIDLLKGLATMLSLYLRRTSTNLLQVQERKG